MVLGLWQVGLSRGGGSLSWWDNDDGVEYMW